MIDAIDFWFGLFCAVSGAVVWLLQLHWGETRQMRMFAPVAIVFNLLAILTFVLAIITDPKITLTLVLATNILMIVLATWDVTGKKENS